MAGRIATDTVLMTWVGGTKKVDLHPTPNTPGTVTAIDKKRLERAVAVQTVCSAGYELVSTVHGYLIFQKFS